MTDQVRREESAESELLDTLLDAADAPAAQRDAATPEQTVVAAAQPTPEQAPVMAAPEAPVASPEAPEAPAAVAAEEPAAVSAEEPAAVSAEEPAAVSAEEPVAAPQMPAAVAAEEPAAVAAADVVAAAEAPAVVAAEAPAAVAAEAPAEGAGASFTPVAEEEVRPRKLKDLQPGMELEGRVTSIALYGVFVDIGVGRDGLVHISEMSDTRIETPSDLVQIGDTVKVRIKSIDPEARRISLTMRSTGGEKSDGSRGGRSRAKRVEVDKERLASMKVGDVVEGVITGYAPFGAFADIGVGKDGLIHVSELAEGRVEKPEDAVKVGDRLQFKVLEVDPEGTRISLSLRRAQRSQKMQGLEVGQVLEGTVSGIAPFGAFVDIGVGRDGLVHISALSSNRVNRVEDVVKVGDKVTVKVLEVDSQSKRISLTMRLDEPEPSAAREREEESYTSSVAPAPRPAATTTRFASAAEARAGRDRDRERRERRERVRGNAPAQPETYSTEDVDEEFVGDATLEDLLTKFGGPGSARRDRKGSRRDEDFDDDGVEDRHERRQRDAIKRTLQQVGRDE